MGTISNPQIEIVDKSGDGDVVQISDGTVFTKKMSVLAAGDAALAANGLLLMALDPSNNALGLKVNAGGALLVTGGGGGFEVLDGQLAVPATDLGRIIAGFDGLNYQFIKTDSDGNLQVDVLSGGGGGEQHLDGDSITGAKGTAALGSDGTNFRWLTVDTNGRLLVDIVDKLARQLGITYTPNFVYNGTFVFGEITTSATTKLKVYKTAYTEQSAAAQRSIVSSSASDKGLVPFGTGAWTVKIIYLDATGSGPYEETVILNGTTPVNTVATNIRFIERMVVMTAGSNGAPVGTISLKSAVGGGGTTIGSIAPGDNRTSWVHHYVPSGKTCYITAVSFANTAVSAGDGATFLLEYQDVIIGIGTVSTQITDFLTLSAADNSTKIRPYVSPLKLVGPTKIYGYVIPNSATSVNQRLGFDYYEI